jgi:small subunit ribosomal protein S17
MKQFIGKVVSHKMAKTAVVEVSRRVSHPLYQKSVTRKKRYHLHDEVGTTVGDLVKFVTVRPISKMKRWKISEIIK